MKLTLGQTSRIIDLSKDISGCLTLYDGSISRTATFDATKFQIVDRVAKGDYFYFVILANAGSNCNVQGRCGAAQDNTLIWLKLNQQLQVEDRQTAIINSCYARDIDVIEGDIKYDDDGMSPTATMNNGTLTVEYDENRYTESAEYKVSRLVYKSAEAEKGFSITTEKKERPKDN
jgi:hypothetical protein